MAHSAAVPEENDVLGGGLATALGSGGQQLADGHSEHGGAEHLQHVSPGVEVVWAT